MTTVGRVALSFIAALFRVQQCRAADAVTEEMIKRLSATPVDRGVLSEILLLPEAPELTVALKHAFERQQEPRGKQYIAAALVQLGEPDPRFYDYLASRAEETMASSGPTWFGYDSEGKAIRGEYSLEFRAWCSSNGVDLREGAARQIRALDDIQILANTRDPRATELLVRALRSPNNYVVVAAAEGLALRRVNSAIPAIVAAAQRLPPASSWVIARELALYGTPEADRELARIIKDPIAVIEYKKHLAFQRNAYDQTDRAKLGLSSPGNPKSTGK